MLQPNGLSQSLGPTAEARVPTVKRHVDGTHRLVSPAETVERMRGHFGPLGITRVANVTGLDCVGIPVVLVCRPNARSVAVSQGKGVDLDAARASGIMESIELYHAERIVKPLVLASHNDLRFSHELVDIASLPRVSISPYHDALTLLWIQGIDLIGGREVWLPYELVHTNFVLPLPTGSGCFVMSSNGLSSGNHPLEAISHGLCEVIERDAAALWELLDEADRNSRKLDNDSIDDARCRALLELYERAGIGVAIWDITSDIGVATFKCCVLEHEVQTFRWLGPGQGLGCHPAREVALLRALTEAAQSRLTLISGSRDDIGRSRYLEARQLEAQVRADLQHRGERAFRQVMTLNSDSLEGDVAAILGCLTRAGLNQAICVDLTRREFGIPVVRMVVPGLESHHEVQGFSYGVRGQRHAKHQR